jgi:hypothetical protein
MWSRTHRNANRPGIPQTSGPDAVPIERADTGNPALDGYDVLDRAEGRNPRRGLSERSTRVQFDYRIPEE